jgi:two-component system, OmpR family, response regulator MprA
MDDTWPLVLLVEDDGAVRRSLERALPLHEFRVIAVNDGLHALQALAAEHPDVVLLDVGLPGPDGIAITERLRDDGDAVPILMLTARTTVADRVSGLDAGADDYLTKPFALDELIARIHALLRRRTPDEPIKRLRFLDVTLDLSQRTVDRAGTPVPLTPTEFLLLSVLMSAPKRILTRDQLWEYVWGETETNPNRLEQHIAGLRRKLEADGAPRIVQTVRGVGYTVRE